MKERLVPELRFPEFSGEWEEKDLSKLVNRITTRNSNNESDHVLTISAEMGLIDQEEYFNKRVASKNLKNYYLISKNNFAYNKSYSNGYPYGVIKKLNRYEKGVLSSLYICFESKYNNHEYLEHYFNTTKWYKEIYKIAVEGARNHGLLNIGIQDFFDIKIKFPQIEEQNKIAKLFTMISKKIEIQEEKIMNLEEYKNGMMQRIFSQEIRFKNDKSNDYPDWEEKKLGDISIVKTGSTPPTKDITNYGESYLFVAPGDLGKHKYIKDTEKKLSEKGFNISRRFKKGSILFTCIGSTIGKIGIAKMDLTSNQQINAILPNNKYSSEYLYYILSYLAEKIKSLAAMQAVPIINKTDFEQILILMPCLLEQNKIANALSSIDLKIDKEREKLDYLKQFKKGLTKKMFI